MRFPATRAAFEPAFIDIRRALDARGVQGRARYNAELAFEEIVSNVIRHGCTDGRLHHIEVTLGCRRDAIVLTFDDDGLPFDPLGRPDPVLPKSLEEASLGGLGILLLRKASTSLSYERTFDQKNRLTVTIATG